MKEELIRIIDKYDIISFDIFDTLLLRNLNKPTDLFKILENIANDKYKIENFYNIRIQSEKESRTESNNYECNLDEIYQKISKHIKNKNILKELKETEIDLEKEFCVANPFMKYIYDYCIKKNKKIVLISDMYLNEKNILDILNKEGYKNVSLYLSNKYHENKGTSKLYEIVYNENKFNKDKWMHIGDNTYSDYEVPIKFGISAYNYKNVSTYSNIVPNSIFESIILGIRNNYLNNGLDIDYWDDFGVRYASLIYFGFTKWLYDLTKDEDNLFFIARDGYIIKQIYDIFNENSKIFTNYLYCSRKSIQIPSLVNSSKDKLVNSFTQGYPENFSITLEEFLKNSSVNLNDIKDLSIFKIFGFNNLDDIVCKNNYNQAKKLLAKLVDNIKKNLEASKALAIEYLKQEKLVQFKKINIMDIGWSGSIQEAISNLLEKEAIGYYFGTIDSSKKDSYCNMFGYYFDLDKKKEDKEAILNYVMMYEFLFSAPHGSTIKYQYDNKKVVPILEKESNLSNITSKFQKSAINIIREYLKYLKYFDSLDKYFCVKPYQEFLETQKIDDIKMFTELSTDYLLGSEEKIPYVNKIKISEINSSSAILLEKIEKSLWKNSFYIEDNIENIEKYYTKTKLKFNNLKYKELSLTPLRCAKIYLNCGNGFNEEESVLVPYEKRGENYYFEFNIPSKIHEIRIDPVEGVKILIKNLIIFTNEGNVECNIPRKNLLYGKKLNGIYINSKDPKIIIKKLNNPKKITFSAKIEILR